jgi:ABC-type phosphate/phosphonate transport system permease subunit
MYLGRYLQMMQYDGVVTLLAVVFVAIVAMDAGSLWLRRRYITRIPGPR